METLKRHPLSVGLAAFLLALAGTAGGLALRAQAQADSIATRAVERHEQRDLETAHPASKHLGERLDRLAEQLREAREALRRIEGALQR